MATKNCNERTNKVTAGNLAQTQKRNAGRTKALAEAIILQAIEDLWSVKEKPDCIDFFTGEGFHSCAKMVGMNFDEKIKVLNLVKNISGKIRRIAPAPRGIKVKRSNIMEEAVPV